MSRTLTTLLLPVLALAFLELGCVNASRIYIGPQLPIGEVAILQSGQGRAGYPSTINGEPMPDWGDFKPGKEGDSTGMYLWSIDGIRGPSSRYGWGHRYTIELGIGSHRLEFGFASWKGNDLEYSQHLQSVDHAFEPRKIYEASPDISNVFTLGDLRVLRRTWKPSVVEVGPIPLDFKRPGGVDANMTATGAAAASPFASWPFPPTPPLAAGAAGRVRSIQLNAGPTVAFVVIEAGSFRMGMADGDPDEKPVHDVRISRDFEIGQYEVTQAQWAAVMGDNPSHHSKCGYCPVERVSWDDVQHFLAKMNARQDGYTYRLPTEAEWEYAARAGTTGPWAGNLDEMAFFAIVDGETNYVGRKRPNAWGLYDMYGNVAEWVSDWYSNSYGSSSAVADPTGPSSGRGRVIRGGYWAEMARNCRSAKRMWGVPDTRYSTIGFRLLRVRG